MIRNAIKTDAIHLARLHSETLTESFLSNLGVSFLSKLYDFLVKTEKVLVKIDQNQIKGFVSFSNDSAKMMKRFLFSCPGCMVLLIIKTAFRPSILKLLFETFQAPIKSKNKNGLAMLPSGELLSISVDTNCQASGVGSQLLKALEADLMENNIFHYKVIAGEKLKSANQFYLKNGFILVDQILIHGKEASNIYTKHLSK
jgi:ribosomal protein S18 acetylase RimI-like enzyme